MSKKPAIPVFNHPIIETHCHLDYLDAQALEQALQAAKAVNVERIITIGVSPDNLDVVVNIASQYNEVWGTQGIHPHDAKDYSAEVEQKIRTNTQQAKILAIGEIGLDYHYDYSDRTQQREAFESQLQIAIDLNRPVVIHTREADEDTAAILKNFIPQMKQRGVIHSFTSGQALAEYCLGEGFCLGFNGISTFKPAENVRDIIALTPIEQILFETDAPYLTPVPYRGQTNEPKYLPFIAEKVATVKGIAIEELLPQVWKNSMELFWRAA
ncbi:MAG: TatD family hydrolase [Thiofilum sp.]|uniref:TatD family hydrolase n=1 Tax=Thiofilum sp. TaxID=2212733 RepID=UPI0025E83749|nr:TatD family hydrolase [Thiofilum sp.]MBK8452486.1 TatD family hydrolase [Thiofilum sp.]